MTLSAVPWKAEPEMKISFAKLRIRIYGPGNQVFFEMFINEVRSSILIEDKWFSVEKKAVDSFVLGMNQCILQGLANQRSGP